MQDGIFFLGTAGDTIAISKQFLSSGGILVKKERTIFHLDPGPGALVRAKEHNYNLRENTAILVSTQDYQHANDVNAVISAMTYDGLDKHGLLVMPPAQEEYQTVSPTHAKQVERVLQLVPGSRVGINDIDVHAIELENTPGTGYFLDLHTSTIAYVPHCTINEELVNKLKGTDTLIIEFRNYEKQEPGFLNKQDIIDLVSQVKPQRAILTGFGIKVLENDPTNIAREIHKATGIEIISAKDGLQVVHIPGKKQQTLEGF